MASIWHGLRVVIDTLRAPSATRHPEKAGTVTVPGKMSKDVAIGTLKSIWKQAQLEEED